MRNSQHAADRRRQGEPQSNNKVVCPVGAVSKPQVHWLRNAPLAHRHEIRRLLLLGVERFLEQRREQALSPKYGHFGCSRSCSKTVIGPGIAAIIWKR